ncbi:ABC transporter ATP-binding protein [Schleiferilactobacillus shenzhenensis]|uniref:ABC transporter ATP-binding protein n=1 Tax=Schleiferilactobacillus shenzhenensis TaxID=1231337 RepID=UPI0004051BFF|nr:ABC transporter ATP-binding protein [Schleiferilactobacillus shenzhenensis]
MARLTLENLAMTYGHGDPVLHDLSLAVADGQLVSLLGPSGSGKTTTLRIIAGLLQQTSGTIKVDDDDISRVPVYKRGLSMVFQSYALFPHLTVFANVAYGLKRQRISKAETTQRVTAMLATTGLNDLAERYPQELSGGQQQRVALARALVVDPRLLLLDEPLSNLDAKLRVSMREEIRRLQLQLHTTTIFVTHDQEECFAISDKVAVLNQGKIEQYAAPEEIYHHPATEFVARFIGFENFLPVNGTVADHAYRVGDQTVRVNVATDGAAKVLTIRPNQIRLVPEGPEVLSGQVTIRTYLGSAYRYTVDSPLGALQIDGPTEAPVAVGAPLHFTLPAEHLLPLEA